MKQSKLLKTITYILIPIIIAIMILSFLSYYGQNYENIRTNEKEYFATDQFVSRYMDILSTFSNRLIYKNEELPTCYDGEMQIAYLGDYQNYETSIQDCYALIIYQNKAITNVELTAETNTIEKIKNFIAQNENAKKVNILAGNVEADSDVILNKAIKYFDYFETRYYTIEAQEQSEEAIAVTDELEYEEEIYEAPTKTQTRNYITTHIQDFTIFSSYKEELKQNAGDIYIQQFLGRYNSWGEKIYIILPIGLAGLFLLGIYLIISIGHTKGKEGIDLNDLDKIPYEVIGFAFLVGMGIVISVISIFDGVMFIQEDMNLFFSILLMAYVITYLLSAVLFDTTVKRIKAKTFFKNTWTYQCCKWMIYIIKKPILKMKQLWNESMQAAGLVKKLLMVILGYLVIAILLIAIFQGFGLLLAIGLAIYIFFKIVKRINRFYQDRKSLKSNV